MRLLLGFGAAWLALDRSAARTGSLLGEAGLLVGAIAVAAAIAVETILFRTPLRAAPRALGLGWPAARGVIASLTLACVLLAFYPVFAWSSGVQLALRKDFLLLVPGLFAQGGIGEEVVFRGFLYRHLRARHGFWRAALLALPPFVAVHLLLFTSMPPAIAAVATVVSVSLTFPLARLFDLGGATVWAPAILHFVVQGSIKIVVTADQSAQTTLALCWMAFSTVVPWAVFALRERPPGSTTRAVT
jgi:membrane protease YdiL (CAAX protease family)